MSFRNGNGGSVARRLFRGFLSGTKFDAGKCRPTLILRDMKLAVDAVVQLGEYGAGKYSKGDWQYVPHAIERYTDAMLRHVLVFGEGSDVGEDGEGNEECGEDGAGEGSEGRGGDVGEGGEGGDVGDVAGESYGSEAYDSESEFLHAVHVAWNALARLELILRKGVPARLPTSSDE